MLVLVGGVFAILGIALFAGAVSMEFSSANKGKNSHYLVCGLLSLIVCFALGAATIFGVPQYKVWQQGKDGEAALAKATQDRQIKVQEAEAELDAASKQAEANKILGQSVRDYPEAMEQKWVEAIAKTQNQVIYLPTEASIPITESGRMALKKQQQDQQEKK